MELVPYSIRDKGYRLELFTIVVGHLLSIGTCSRSPRYPAKSNRNSTCAYGLRVCCGHVQSQARPSHTLACRRSLKLPAELSWTCSSLDVSSVYPICFTRISRLLRRCYERSRSALGYFLTR